MNTLALPIDALQPAVPPAAPERRVFLATTEVATRREVRFAMFAALVSVAAFCAMVPYATVQLPKVPAFIPAYESALVICDLITAVLLFGQYNFLRSRAIYVLACGYLFTAFIAFAHALTFPGVFAPGGLLGAGAQSTAWLYLVWHGGFPLFVVGYIAIGRGGASRAASAPGDSATFAIYTAVVGMFLVASACTYLVTELEDELPALVIEGRFTPALTAVVSGVWVLSMLALVMLWRRRPHTVMDLWLMVVMCAWLADIALSAVLNAGRYDLGWYSGRLYGLFAASSLLVVLLLENGAHYPRLAALSAQLSVANIALEEISLQDSLTDIANRRYFDRYLAAQVGTARRYGRDLALVMCDVDDFKAFNDLYGHQAGDECLRRIALALKGCCRRPADLPARYGGEEFAIILPDTPAAGAAILAEAVRDAVAQLKIPHGRSASGRFVTISGGIAALHGSEVISAQQLTEVADRMLYEAKRTGRNRMFAAQAAAT